jgi:hypothetical protein
MRWIFKRAHQLGLKHYLFTYQIVTTSAFAAAHGMAIEMPESDTVDWRHNLKHTMGAQYGIRNELTRAYTEAAIAEVFNVYKDLDGLSGGMAEALPGKRSTWFLEAVAPGLKRSGRNRVFQMMNWMLPLDEFIDDIVAKQVYDNLWVSVMHNGETLTDGRLNWRIVCGVRISAKVRPWTNAKITPRRGQLEHNQLEKAQFVLIPVGGRRVD